MKLQKQIKHDPHYCHSNHRVWLIPLHRPNTQHIYETANFELANHLGIPIEK